MFQWTSYALLECIGIGGIGHSFERDTAYCHAAKDLEYATISLAPLYDCSVPYANVYVLSPVGRVFFLLCLSSVGMQTLGVYL
jgi:hypothetical protein